MSRSLQILCIFCIVLGMLMFMGGGLWACYSHFMSIHSFMITGIGGGILLMAITALIPKQ